MKTKEEIIKTLGELKEILQKKYRVKEVGIFGSVIRGQENFCKQKQEKFA